MVVINEEKCIGCGLCVGDCLPHNIKIENNKALLVKDKCFQCGHCVAICPKNAVSIDDYDSSGIVDVINPPVTPVELLNFIKSRRSIRHFKEDKIEKSKIQNILDAGRYSPTAQNSQDLSYFVIDEKMQEFKALVIESLGEKGNEMLKNPELPEGFKFYANLWVNLAENFKKDPNAKDLVFFNAPLVILITSNSPIDVGIATSNMELMVNAEQLGMFYSGIITAGCQKNDAIKNMLGSTDEVVMALVIGYPDVKYQRSTPKKNVNISWL